MSVYLLAALLLAGPQAPFAPVPPDPYVRAVVILPTIADQNWEVKAVADVIGDTQQYIIWRHKLSGLNVIWILRGGVLQQAAFLPGLDPEWIIAGASVGGILWRNTVTGENVFWKMTRPD